MSEWISIKDELPSPHERVLLLRTTGRIQRMIVGFYSNDNFWYDIDDLWDKPLMNITHWQPLPELPNQEKNNNTIMTNQVLTNFALNWIYELMCSMSCVKTAFEDRNDSWQKSVDYTIELRAWREQYRKVSQLCHNIGGVVLEKFKEIFPNGIDTYKTQSY